MQTTDEHDLTLAEVLRKAMELTVNEDGERMFDNIPEEEDLAMLDPARPVPEADGVAEADATTVYADANDVDVEIDDDDLELLDRFEDFDDEALEGAMKRQAAEGRREGNREEEQGKQRAHHWQEGNDREIQLPIEGDALSLDVVCDWDGNEAKERMWLCTPVPSVAPNV